MTKEAMHARALNAVARNFTRKPMDMEDALECLEPAAATTKAGELRDIPISELSPSPYQPRMRPIGPSDVAELRQSIAAIGQTTPIIVSPGTGELAGKFVVHSGHRRWTAIKLMGGTSIRAEIRRDMDERAARRLALADNLGRDDLTAFEQSMALKGYVDVSKLTLEKAAQELGVQRATAFRLKKLWGASQALMDELKQSTFSARAASLLVDIEHKSKRRALRLAKQYAAGSVSLKTLEAEAKRKQKDEGAARKEKIRPEVLLECTKGSIKMSIDLRRDEVSPGRRERVAQAVAALLWEMQIPPEKVATLTQERRQRGD